MLMHAIGNKEVNIILEANMPNTLKINTSATREEREQFIITKYVAKKYLGTIDIRPESFISNETVITHRKSAYIKSSISTLFKLLLTGTNVNWCNENGQTLLHTCVQYGILGGIELLFLWDVNPEVPDTLHRTPLLMSAKLEDLECTRLLLNHNASTKNINIEEFMGKQVQALLREGATTIPLQTLRRKKVFEEVKEIKELFENLAPKRTFKPKKKKIRSPLRNIKTSSAKVFQPIDMESQSQSSSTFGISEEDIFKSTLHKNLFSRKSTTLPYIIKTTISETDSPSETFSFERSSTSSTTEGWNISRDSVVKTTPLSLSLLYTPINIIYDTDNTTEPPPVSEETTNSLVRRQPHLLQQRVNN